jgi:hypothetical protein
MGVPIRALQNSFFQGRDAVIKEFKLEILICFITEHLTPLCQTPHIFAMLKAVGGKLQTFLKLQK